MSAAFDHLYSFIHQEDEQLNGNLHVAITDIKSGEELHYRSDERVKTASVIKLPILVHIALLCHEGKQSWNEKLALTDQEKVAGSGVLTGLSEGLEISVRDLCQLMIVISDNTATNMLIERFGIAPINEGVRSLGLLQTQVFRKAYSPDDPNSESNLFGLGVTTARECNHLLKLLTNPSIIPDKVSQSVLSIMSQQQYRDYLPRFLPQDWHYAGKTGGVDGIRNDVGIITSSGGNNYAVSAFTQGLTDLRWTPENDGVMTIARVGRRLVEAMS